MISFMTYETAHQLQLDINQKVKIFNFTSFKMGYKKLNIFPRRECLQYVNQGKLFDQMYAVQLLEDEQMFLDLMQVIVQAYDGVEIVILVTFGNGWDFIVESLEKFLQQRYGFISSTITCAEDYETIEDFPTNPMYLYNLENDIARFRDKFIEWFGADTFEASIVDEYSFCNKNKFKEYNPNIY